MTLLNWKDSETHGIFAKKINYGYVKQMNEWQQKMQVNYLSSNEVLINVAFFIT